MFIVQHYSVAILLCVVTMVCWGSWANTTKLTSRDWRFELFYWDYGIGIVLMSLFLSLTLGSNGIAGRPFLDDLKQASAIDLRSAFTGGVLFNLANILLVAAIAIAGMSVAFPVGIGIALVLGVVLNYSLQPQGNPTILFSGVALITAAILMNAYAYRKATAASRVSQKGLLLSVISGCLMGLFYKYVAASMASDFSQPEAGKLTPYTALFIFALGVFASSFLFNALQMRWPFSGSPLSIHTYFKGSSRNHIVGMIGGAIWCTGMALNIIASGKAGPAISYGLGQGATVVAAIWGIYIWKEFDRANPGTKRILTVMLLTYIIGLGLLIAAK
jgi:glucose uptake protein